MPRPKLTNKEFIARALAVAEEKIADGELIRQFRPNDGGQQAFCESNAHTKFLSGANSSGKTYVGLVMDGFHVIAEKDKYGKPTGFTINPYQRLRIPTGGRQVWLSSYSQDVQKENIDPLFKMLLKPYVLPGKDHIEAGVRQWAHFDGGTLNMKWQTQGLDSYTGAKLDAIHYDEPHTEAIFNEGQARLIQKDGWSWTTLTPVISARQTALRASEIVWLKRKILDPWLRDQATFEDMEVFFVDIEENAMYVDPLVAMRRFQHMDRAERHVRKTGIPIEIAGDICFEPESMDLLGEYQDAHPEETQPEYGVLMHDAGESDEMFKITFLETRPAFPEHPTMGWTFKIWEHPLKNEALARPYYYIGCDAAEGMEGGDYSSAYVKRSDSKQIVAALHGHLSEIELAKQLWLLGWYYANISRTTGQFEPATLAIEVNNIGKTTLTLLLNGFKERGIKPYQRGSIYRRPRIEDLHAGLHVPGDVWGWQTTAGTRHYLITEARISLANAVDEIVKPARTRGPLLIPDTGWLAEARSMVRDSSGKYAAISGLFDDRILSGAIADMAIKQGVFTTPVYNWKPRVQEEEALLIAVPDQDMTNGVRFTINEAALEKLRGRKAQSEERDPMLWL